METLFVIKIGGQIIDQEASLEGFLQAFARLKGKKILVHGGGKLATRIGAALNIDSHYVDGRRITDAATLDLVTMVYGGLINKKLVARLQALGCPSLGITGADANLIPAHKRSVKEVDYGFVGDVNSEELDSETWSLLLNAGITPVVAPLTHDGKGSLLNTNADTIAQEVAKALSRRFDVQLVYSFEKSGVLRDVEDEATRIPVLNPELYAQLKASQNIFAGMIPKLDNAFTALHHGVKKVIIGKAEELDSLIAGKTGTSIQHE